MSAVSYHKLHALVVDDFENFRATLYRMLADLGIGQVDSASSGEEALRSARSRAYDLILCDHNLGKGKTGQQVLEDLRTQNLLSSDCLFILVTAESSKSIIMAAYDFEPDAYLTKPITSKVLEQRLARLFEQRNQLLPILTARAKGNIAEAISLCKSQILAAGRYTNHCQKILGQLYLEHQQAEQAEALYRSLLDVRELEWAQLGMARAKFAQGDNLAALQWLETVLQNNPLCMKAYDIQADIYRAQGANQALQNVLTQATELSPLSILRQQALGQIALQNNDLVSAVGALKRAVRLGEHSSFDSAEIHAQFAQAAVELSAVDKDLALPMVRDAIKVAAAMDAKFGRLSSQKANALFLETQLQACCGEGRKALECFEKAQLSLEGLEGDAELTAEIEMIRALRSLGKESEALEQLSLLTQKYAGQQAALERLDVLQEEPHSEKNKQLVAEINTRGIAAYNAKNFAMAAEAFSAALQSLPNHIGLRLNYVQAAIDDLKINFAQSQSDRVAASLAKTGRIISPQHPQYRRYRQLNDTFNSLVKELGTKSEVNP